MFEFFETVRLYKITLFGHRIRINYKTLIKQRCKKQTRATKLKTHAFMFIVNRLLLASLEQNNI